MQNWVTLYTQIPIRDKEEGAIPTDRSGNNGLAIPTTSTKD